MFLGPPLPLPADTRLPELLSYAQASGVLGAWVRGCSPGQRLYELRHPAGGRVIAGPDLGFLLARCHRVVLRQGEAPLVLDAETVIRWRALQVATATPFLPGAERLRALYPGLQSSGNGLLVPLRAQSPEEVLAHCLMEGISVTGSRVVYEVGEKKDLWQHSPFSR
jgi:hypothetical protein